MIAWWVLLTLVAGPVLIDTVDARMDGQTLILDVRGAEPLAARKARGKVIGNRIFLFLPDTRVRLTARRWTAGVLPVVSHRHRSEVELEVVLPPKATCDDKVDLAVGDTGTLQARFNCPGLAEELAAGSPRNTTPSNTASSTPSPQSPAPTAAPDQAGQAYQNPAPSTGGTSGGAAVVPAAAAATLDPQTVSGPDGGVEARIQTAAADSTAASSAAGSEPSPPPSPTAAATVQQAQPPEIEIDFGLDARLRFVLFMLTAAALSSVVWAASRWLDLRRLVRRRKLKILKRRSQGGGNAILLAQSDETFYLAEVVGGQIITVQQTEETDLRNVDDLG